MWPRTVELMLGCWLVVSPFVFRHDPGQTMLWTTDLGAGALVILLALVCWWRPLRRAHLAMLVVSALLVGRAWLAASGAHPPAAYQNHIVVGLLLMMFNVIPSEATLPPPSWRETAGSPPRR